MSPNVMLDGSLKKVQKSLPKKYTGKKERKTAKK